MRGDIKTLLAAGVLSLTLCGAAHANSEVPFAKDVGGAHLTGTVEIDDSSGDIVAVAGEASVAGEVGGAVSGKFTLDRVTLDAEVGSKLTLHFDRRNQQIDARVDGAAPVTVWRKP